LQYYKKENTHFSFAQGHPQKKRGTDGKRRKQAETGWKQKENRKWFWIYWIEKAVEIWVNW